ncbi:MAG: BrnT family toxin [Symploca sp. SIO1C2]|nr:BrnT family toxin [Symploca sp. SIO1C2]
MRINSAKQELSLTYNEAATVFGDFLSVTFPDPDHSIGESRYVTIGLSRFSQLLVVAHTDRGNRIRLISARRTTRQEQSFYEEGS